MVAVYAVFVLLGVSGIIGWVLFGIAATAWSGEESLDPETRFGSRGRDVVAVLTGFGLGGMSASFAGWGTALALAGALLGAFGAVLIGRYLGVEEDADGDPA